MEQTSQTMKKLPSFSELLTSAKDMVMKRKELFFLLAALPAIIQLIGVVLLAVMPALAPLSILLMIASIIVTLLVTISMVKSVADEGITDWKKVLTESKALFLPYLLTSILVVIVIMVGFVLFILPGIFLSIALGFYNYALILENKRGWDSAQRSKELVKGYWWAIFGRMFLFGLVIALLAAIFAGIIGVMQSEVLNAIASAIINIIVTPIAVAYSYLIYKSLQSIKGVSTMTHEA